MPFAAVQTMFVYPAINEYRLDKLVEDACKKAWVLMNDISAKPLTREDVGSVLVSVGYVALNKGRSIPVMLAYRIDFYYKDRGRTFDSLLKERLQVTTSELLQPELRCDYKVEINTCPSPCWSDAPNWATVTQECNRPHVDGSVRFHGDAGFHDKCGFPISNGKCTHCD